MNIRIFELSRKLEGCCNSIAEVNGSIEWCENQIDKTTIKLEDARSRKAIHENTIKEIMNEIKNLEDEA